ncbi:MAG: hypothetical protein HYR64_09855 [Fimbriimonas ginsengisoli]|uniref:KAP NTPase domain-containing protein n=1 Tax=Fimbriimonas ginsengisoli TaxID=1005039 RepID=A0A931PX66_FIMGI|nr:hypothetical protein [Fimbriimonas ginsengisoli]
MLTGKKSRTESYSTPVITAIGFAFVLTVALTPVGINLRTGFGPFWTVVGWVLTCSTVLLLVGLLVYQYLYPPVEPKKPNADGGRPVAEPVDVKVSAKKNGFWARLKQAARLSLALASKTSDTQLVSESFQGIEATTVEFEGRFRKLLDEAMPKEKGRTLVVVLDNLDRLPESVAETAWSTLSAFLDLNHEGQSRRNHRKLWLVVPVNHSALVPWGDLTDAKEGAATETGPAQVATQPALNHLLSKAFQVEFNVPKPLDSGWKKYLRECLRQALREKSRPGEREKISNVFEAGHYWTAADRPTPREIRRYVNNVVALYTSQRAEASLLVVALFVARNMSEWPAENLIKQILVPPAVSDLFEADPQVDLAALYYGVNADNAKEILLVQQIVQALASPNPNDARAALKALESQDAFLDKFTSCLRHLPADENLLENHLVNGVCFYDGTPPADQVKNATFIANALINHPSWSALSKRTGEAMVAATTILGKPVDNALPALWSSLPDPAAAKETLGTKLDDWAMCFAEVRHLLPEAPGSIPWPGALSSWAPEDTLALADSLAAAGVTGSNLHPAGFDPLPVDVTAVLEERLSPEGFSAIRDAFWSAVPDPRFLKADFSALSAHITVLLDAYRSPNELLLTTHGMFLWKLINRFERAESAAVQAAGSTQLHGLVSSGLASRHIKEFLNHGDEKSAGLLLANVLLHLPQAELLEEAQTDHQESIEALTASSALATVVGVALEAADARNRLNEFLERLCQDGLGPLIPGALQCLDASPALAKNVLPSTVISNPLLHQAVGQDYAPLTQSLVDQGLVSELTDGALDLGRTDLYLATATFVNTSQGARPRKLAKVTDLVNFFQTGLNAIPQTTWAREMDKPGLAVKFLSGLRQIGLPLQVGGALGAALRQRVDALTSSPLSADIDELWKAAGKAEQAVLSRNLVDRLVEGGPGMHAAWKGFGSLIEPSKLESEADKLARSVILKAYEGGTEEDFALASAIIERCPGVLTRAKMTTKDTLRSAVANPDIEPTPGRKAVKDSVLSVLGQSSPPKRPQPRG